MKREELAPWLEGNRAQYTGMSDQIWEFAELQYRENRSSQLQAGYLAERGFEIAGNLAGMPTAFQASWGSGGPVIAILGEYDALDGLSQEAGADRYVPLEKSAGHGCGHNLLGTAGVAAAEAVREYLITNKIKGTIRYYGCPAEEGGAGKTFMVRSGCFKDVDAALTWHPSSKNTMFTTGTLANFQVRFTFRGQSSHAAASPHMGRSALDALELMNVGVNFLREHMIPQARVHYAIVNTGGTAPNVVQSEAEAIYLIRAPRLYQTKEIYSRVVRIARGAALMTDTAVTAKFQTGVSDYLANRVLTAQLEKNFSGLFPWPGIAQEDIRYMRRLREEMQGEVFLSDREAAEFIEKNGYCGSLLPQDGSSAFASTDVGDVSWVVPTGQFEAACYAYGTSSHSWQRTAQGKSGMAHAGMMAAAKVMALTACDLLEDEALLLKAGKELEEDRGGSEYECPIPAEIEPEI